MIMCSDKPLSYSQHYEGQGSYGLESLGGHASYQGHQGQQGQHSHDVETIEWLKSELRRTEDGMIKTQLQV